MNSLERSNLELRTRIAQLLKEQEGTMQKLTQLAQEDRAIHREISNLFALFVGLGTENLHEERILRISFKDEIERIQNIRIMILEKIHHAESAERQNKHLRKLLESSNR